MDQSGSDRRGHYGRSRRLSACLILAAVSQLAIDAEAQTLIYNDPNNGVQVYKTVSTDLVKIELVPWGYAEAAATAYVRPAGHAEQSYVKYWHWGSYQSAYEWREYWAIYEGNAGGWLTWIYAVEANPAYTSASGPTAPTDPPYGGVLEPPPPSWSSWWDGLILRVAIDDGSSGTLAEHDLMTGASAYYDNGGTSSQAAFDAAYGAEIAGTDHSDRYDFLIAADDDDLVSLESSGCGAPPHDEFFTVNGFPGWYQYLDIDGDGCADQTNEWFDYGQGWNLDAVTFRGSDPDPYDPAVGCRCCESGQTVVTGESCPEDPPQNCPCGISADGQNCQTCDPCPCGYAANGQCDYPTTHENCECTYNCVAGTCDNCEGCQCGWEPDGSCSDCEECPCGEDEFGDCISDCPCPCGADENGDCIPCGCECGEDENGDCIQCPECSDTECDEGCDESHPDWPRCTPCCEDEPDPDPPWECDDCDCIEEIKAQFDVFFEDLKTAFLPSMPNPEDGAPIYFEIEYPLLDDGVRETHVFQFRPTGEILTFGANTNGVIVNQVITDGVSALRQVLLFVLVYQWAMLVVGWFRQS